MNILIVDDEVSYRFLVKNALEEEPQWKVFEAEHGEDGLDILHDEKIDIIVSDVYMPIMDGIKFHKNVRAMEACALTPFLFVSAYDDDYTKAAITNSAIEGFVRKGKPVSFLKEWIKYLTTPHEMRPPMPPSDEGKSRFSRSTRDRGRGGAQTPML